ncbi:phage tail protein, partial [Acinetobacter baumannii]|nr:phage tail protein [Acinetobacter baumannii]
MVAIPYVGPILAVGAGAAAFGLVAGLAGKIKSARGGYDIPAGVNPMTQLHEEEMVLPKQHANTIRALGKSMANGGLGGGGENTAQPVIFSPTIQAWDSKDVRRFFKKHGSELADSLKGYNRNFGK